MRQMVDRFRFIEGKIMPLTPEEIAEEEAELATHERRKHQRNVPRGAVEVGGWLIPEGNDQLAARLLRAPTAGGRATYQFERLLRALSHCSNFRTAIDVGAHVGFHAFWLKQVFSNLILYEPHPEHLNLLNWNLQELHGGAIVSYYGVACGDQAGNARLTSKTSEKTFVVPETTGTIEVWPLDDHAWNAVDFIKIDVEGFEQRVVEGAAKTIERWKPVMLVEQKRDVAEKRYGLEPQGALKAIREIAPYRIVYEHNGDYVLCPKSPS